MLPKQHRISTATIPDVLKNGRVFRSDGVALYTKKTPHTHNIQGAVVVGKKVSKHATKRNYLKRVVRSVVAQNIPKCNSGIYFVFVLKPTNQPHEFQNLKQHIQHLLSISGTIKK